MVTLPEISFYRLVVVAGTGTFILVDKEEAHSILLLAKVKADPRRHGFTFVYTNNLIVVHSHRVFGFVDVAADKPIPGLDPQSTGLSHSLSLQLRGSILLAVEIGYQPTMVVW
jgi:hypothetical protein